MAYDSNKQKITAPVAMADIAIALGVESRSLITLVDSGKVNVDSLFRPYECGQPNMTLAQFQAGGFDGFYGYDIPMTENMNVRDLWMKVWANRPPTKWYHMLHFAGYSHAASYKDFPFRMKLQQAGSAWVVEYECHNDIGGQVNPGAMDSLKTYYPAFQIFAQGSPDTMPSTSPVFSWCGSQQVGAGRSGEYLYGMNLEQGKTYYVIPFLSQYKFTSFNGGNTGIPGKKYAMVYGEWKVTDWAISQGAVSVTKYDAWIDIMNQSSYAITATFGYRFFVDNLYIAPTYRYAVYDANGAQVYNQPSFVAVAPSFNGSINTTYEFPVTISKVNPSGEPWPSGYTIRIFHKEQTSADGSKEFYQDYIIP